LTLKSFSVYIYTQNKYENNLKKILYVWKNNKSRASEHSGGDYYNRTPDAWWDIGGYNWPNNVKNVIYYHWLRLVIRAFFILSFKKNIFYFYIVLQKYLLFLIERYIVPKTNKWFDWETMIEQYIVTTIKIPYHISELFR